MKVLQRPIKFKNQHGANLYGILHTPSKATNDVGIVILSPGIKSRVAPHRLYVKMASRFCELGFTVLRFDPEGLGDSEGEIFEKFTADMYGTIQMGRYTSDTVSAMQWMRRNCDVGKFILSGLCGGAITALLTAHGQKNVCGILSLGIPVIIDASDTDSLNNMTCGQLKGIRKGYFRKLMQPKSWWRLLTLKSDYRQMIRSLFKPFLNKSNQLKNGETKPERNVKNSSENINSNFNPKFPYAFEQTFSNDKKGLFVFSENDRLYWEFEEKFMAPYWNIFEKCKDNISIKIVKNANHIFSFPEWQNEMLSISCAWLYTHFRAP